AASGRGGFTERLVVSTTTQWGATAEETIREQSVPVRRLGLEEFEQSRVDWATFDPATPAALSLAGASDLRPSQRPALDGVAAGPAVAAGAGGVGQQVRGGGDGAGGVPGRESVTQSAVEPGLGGDRCGGPGAAGDHGSGPARAADEGSPHRRRGDARGVRDLSVDRCGRAGAAARRAGTVRSGDLR